MVKKADGILKIRVTHIGEDYGNVEVRNEDGTFEDYEVPKGLAEAMKRKQATINKLIAS